jgi:hypothetical protein
VGRFFIPESSIRRPGWSHDLLAASYLGPISGLRDGDIEFLAGFPEPYIGNFVFFGQSIEFLSVPILLIHWEPPVIVPGVVSE